MSRVYKSTAINNYGLSDEDLTTLSYTIKKHRKYKTNMYIYDVDEVKEIAMSKFRCTSPELQQIVGYQNRIQKRKIALKELKKSIIDQAYKCSSQRSRFNMIQKKKEEIKKKSASKRYQSESSEESDSDSDEDYSQDDDDDEDYSQDDDDDDDDDDGDEPVAVVKPRVRNSKV